MIFACVDNVPDAVSLSLVDGDLFELGFPRILELQRLTYANWAGDRIICLGERTEQGDYPASIHEHVDRTLAQWNASAPDSDQEDEDSEYYDERTASFYFKLSDRYEKFRHDGRIGEVDEQQLKKRLGDDLSAYQALIKPRYESSHPWVLCNLSKGVYVRADAIANVSGTISHRTPFIRGIIDLGVAMFSKICWSSDASIAMGYGGDLHRGPWAGDRFEVTTLDKLDDKLEWKDGTAEVTKLVNAIWTADLGREWREVIRGHYNSTSYHPKPCGCH